MKFLKIVLAACIAASASNAKPRRVHSKIEQPDTSAQATGPVGGVSGSWTIDAATTVGACQGLIPATLEIAEGKIAAAPGLEGEAWGYVDEGGVIVARFTTTDGRVARFHGNLRGGHGTGAWSSSTDMCGGTWRAGRGHESASQ